MNFAFHSKLPIPLVADPDPNTTPPDDDRVVEAPSTSSGNQGTDNHFYASYENPAGAQVAAGTVTGRFWVKDLSTGVFVDTGATFAALTSRTLHKVGLLLSGPVFIQITAVGAPGGANPGFVKLHLRTV